MNILFLDMDGVCNCLNYLKWYKAKFHRKYPYTSEFVVPHLAERVTTICTQCDCNIVWSSSWRELYTMEHAKQLFNRKGLPGDRLVGFTPSLNTYPNNGNYVPRGREIRFFIFNNILDQPITKAAVLDDDPDAGLELPPCCKFFQTDYENGLTEKLMHKVIKYFNTPVS